VLTASNFLSVFCLPASHGWGLISRWARSLLGFAVQRMLRSDSLDRTFHEFFLTRVWGPYRTEH